MPPSRRAVSSGGEDGESGQPAGDAHRLSLTEGRAAEQITGVAQARRLPAAGHPGGRERGCQDQIANFGEIASVGHTFNRRTNLKTLERDDSPEQRDSWNRVWTFFEWHLRPYEEHPKPQATAAR